MLVVCNEQRAVQAEARERETVRTAKLRASRGSEGGFKKLRKKVYKVEMAKLEVAELKMLRSTD